MTVDQDTIVAIATPPGRGGIGVVRLSGPGVPVIGEALLGKLPPPRRASLRRFRDRDGCAIDQGIALFFEAPGSFTGEHVLELHAHGGPVILDLLVQSLLELGGRLARPGEFSERAYLNGKLDLAQAEAVADLIDSATAQAARGALHSLQGDFSRRVNALVEQTIALRTYVEAAIDFPEEEIDFLADPQIGARLNALVTGLQRLLREASQGQLLRDGMHVVITGRPNAGKSSLLNSLAGRETAIVTEVPGTTRDLLRERISIDGMPLHVVDTAGLRHATDAIEQEGIRRAWQEIQAADRVLLVIDDRLGLSEEDRELLRRMPSTVSVTLIMNKIDLSGRSPGTSTGEHGSEVYISAKTGRGLCELRAHLRDCMGFRVAGEGTFTARRRHLHALRAAGSAIESAQTVMAGGRAAELIAEELRLAQVALGEITGQFHSDELLGRIFSTFCIGK